MSGGLGKKLKFAPLVVGFVLEKLKPLPVEVVFESPKENTPALAISELAVLLPEIPNAKGVIEGLVAELAKENGESDIEALRDEVPGTDTVTSFFSCTRLGLSSIWSFISICVSVSALVIVPTKAVDELLIGTAGDASV